MIATIPGYFTVAEAVQALHRSHSCVCNYIQNGTLKARRLGREYLIEEKSVKEFVPPPRGNPNFVKRKRKRR